MDTYPITARSLGLYLKVDGNNLERAYKNHLSGFRDWEQASHAEDWVLPFMATSECRVFLPLRLAFLFSFYITHSIQFSGVMIAVSFTS